MVTKQINKHVETSTTTTVAVNGMDIIGWLTMQGYDIPKGATVTFTVPGGGDWSNTSVDVDDENPVEVQWKEVRHE